MEIDVVYTWVNHQDPTWLSLKASVTPEGDELIHNSSNDNARYFNRNEIYYSIKSVKRFMPWVRNIYIVTNCAPPPWAINDEQIHIVDHADIFPDPNNTLPTFNSHAIESCLHRIKGLSEHFVYLNDDFFILKPCMPSDFFAEHGVVNVFLSKHNIPRSISSNTRPVDVAANNTAAIILRDFGFLAQKKMHHAPYALLKSVLFEIEKSYKYEVEGTRRNQYRHPSDIPMATTFHAYYCLAKDKAIVTEVAARYIDIGDWRFLGLIHPLSPLMRGRYRFLCLNEVSQIKLGESLRNKIVVYLMVKLFS